jgi:hypothetical protein
MDVFVKICAGIFKRPEICDAFLYKKAHVSIKHVMAILARTRMLPLRASFRPC